MLVHKIKAITWPVIECLCGWATRLLRPDTWGRIRGYDWLLDAHAAHVEREKKRRAGP